MNRFIAANSLRYLPKSHGYRYEMSNCLFEAALEKILEVSVIVYILRQNFRKNDKTFADMSLLSWPHNRQR